eukprot:m.120592 g.120592  ORF g.120592 m.120592 type:complete len:1916 (+) comp21854_c0_seq1:114-5861(+)
MDDFEEGTKVEVGFITPENPLLTLPDPHDKVELQDCLGDGAYGKVYRGKDLVTGLLVAVKVVPLDGSEEDESEVGQEVAVIERHSRHVNIARFFGAYRNRKPLENDELWLSMELCAFGSASGLANKVRSKRSRATLGLTFQYLPEGAVAHVLYGTLSGLEYLHARHVLHRDIKGQNILFSREGVVKLCDFGVSATVQSHKGKRATVIGTPYWMAPEVIACDYGPADYDHRCDIWSVGIVAIELAEGDPPLSAMPPMRALAKIPALPPPTLAKFSTGKWSPAFHQMVKETLIKDCAHRPSATQLMASDFFKTAHDGTGDLQRMFIDLLVRIYPRVAKSKTVADERKSSVHMAKEGGGVGAGLATGDAVDAPANLSQLREISEDSILCALNARYQAGDIYTFVGDILIALNPLVDCGLYTPEHHNAYGAGDTTTTAPHIFATARAAYTAMVTLNSSQCCVISGESGAGKTETAKLFVRHILLMAAGGGSAPSNIEPHHSSSSLEDGIIAVNPLLEAFGNSKTVMNNNSSRFGKLLELTFGGNRTVKGAHMSHYLLEKSRVVHQGEGERNFHALYYFLGGVADDELLPGDASQYALLGGTPPKDSSDEAQNRFTSDHTSREEARWVEADSPRRRGERKATTRHAAARNAKISAGADVIAPDVAAQRYVELMKCMSQLGFSTDECDDVRKVVAGVLHLGNLAFVQQIRDAPVDLTAYEVVFSAANALGLDAIGLVGALRTYTQVTRGEEIIRILTVEQATDTRDATAKAIYGRLFEWIIDRVNETLVVRNDPVSKGSTSTVICILDIFGFEDVGRNDFEQLCINTANEVLQHFFEQHVFAMEIAELSLEGIETDHIAFTSNRPLVDMLLQRKKGVFGVLDDETLFPSSTADTLTQKLDHAFKKNDLYAGSKGGSQQSFTIRHFAADVEYSTKNFLDKNRDTLSHVVKAVLESARNGLVNLLFDNDAAAATASMSSDKLRKSRRTETHRRAPTAGSTFCSSLLSLTDKLKTQSPHFVRCIRPNAKKIPGVFDADVVKSQIRSTGVIATVRIRRGGYSVRTAFAEFLATYQILFLEASKGIAKTEIKRSCATIMEAAANKFELAEGSWQLGKTKVVMKFFVAQRLQQELGEIGRRVLVCQRNVRNFLWRRQLHTRGAARLEQQRVAEQEAAATAAAAAAEATAAAEAAAAADATAQALAAAAARTAEAEAEAEQTAARHTAETINNADVDDDVDADFDADVPLMLAPPVAAVHKGRQNSMLTRDIRNRNRDREARRAKREAQLQRNAERAARRETLAAATLSASSSPTVPEGDELNNGFAPSNAVVAAQDDGKDLFLETLTQKEYEDLDQNFVDRTCLPRGVDALNRYKNILPNPRTRVRLMEQNNIETTRYINANFVQGSDGTPRRYIASQGPLPNTVDAFWRMVWEKDARVLVMVTGLKEKGKHKCARYWPKTLWNPDLNVGDVKYGDISLRIMAGFRKEGFVTSKFEVRKGDVVREVWHFWYDSWPDHGVPRKVKPVIAMLQAARKFSDDPNLPWVVHCSAGIGRTGTFIAVDHGLRMFEQGAVVSVLDIIHALRKDRGGMVQHWEQAEFVQNTLQAYVDEHGAKDMNTILRKSVQKAAAIVPPKFQSHPSQENADEGEEDRVPEWRQEQLDEAKSAEGERLLDLHMDNTLGRKKAGRLAAKQSSKDEERDRVEALLELDDDGEDDFLSFIGTLKVGRGRGSHRERLSSGADVTDDEAVSDGPISEDEAEPATLQRDQSKAARLVHIAMETESIGAPSRRNTPDSFVVSSQGHAAPDGPARTHSTLQTDQRAVGRGPQPSVRLAPSPSEHGGPPGKVETATSTCGPAADSTQWIALAVVVVLIVALAIGVGVGVAVGSIAGIATGGALVGFGLIAVHLWRQRALRGDVAGRYVAEAAV